MRPDKRAFRHLEYARKALPKVSAEVRNTLKVSADSYSGEVAALQLLKHELT